MKVDEALAIVKGLFKEKVKASTFCERDFALIQIQEDLDLDMDNGATKMCIIPDDDKVIKIPFVGSGWHNFQYNYCEKEASIYKKAKEKGVEEFFAATMEAELIECQDGASIMAYFQERVDTHRIRILSNDEWDQASNISDSSPTGMPSSWLLDAFEYYGQERLLEFFSFVRDAKINDIHIDNVGYIGNRPVLLDYSGFYN